MDTLISILIVAVVAVMMGVGFYRVWTGKSKSGGCGGCCGANSCVSKDCGDKPGDESR